MQTATRTTIRRFSSLRRQVFSSTRLPTKNNFFRGYHATSTFSADALDMADTFSRRHVGPSEQDAKCMLETIGFESFDALTKSTVPPDILTDKELNLEPALTESEALNRIKEMADK